MDRVISFALGALVGVAYVVGYWRGAKAVRDKAVAVIEEMKRDSLGAVREAHERALETVRFVRFGY